MSDLIQRLRTRPTGDPYLHMLVHEAADAIERLTAAGSATVKPCAWMARHGREPVQATVSQQQAEAWAQAGGDVVELYDGPTLWNAIATADARRRELQAQIEQLQGRLAQAGLEQQRAVREERERWIAKADATYTDAHAIFNDPPSETPQEVRDVIEWHLAVMLASEGQ